MGKRYRFGFKRLDVYRAAVEHFEWTCTVVQRMPKGPWKVTDQAVGAALSVMGNIGEAHGRDARAGEIEQHYRYAQGSAFESATHLDAFAALGAISDEEYNREEDRLTRIAMMLTRLMQKQRRRRRELKQLRARGATAGGRPGERPEAGPEVGPEVGPARVPSLPKLQEDAAAVSNPRGARPGGRSAAGRFDPPPGEPEGAERPKGSESPRSGVSEAASAADEIEHRG
ncbi:MAG: four helix bundle protein [Gemmatimonadetes bacterium]|nr:four helix bundle protein [Gemmatimonadota bacterium]